MITMKKLNQKGFAHLVIVLIIVIVLAGAGFAGWRIYDQRKNTNINTTSTTSSKTTEEKPKSTIPDGFVEYENKELGFKFAYPKGWGEVTFSEGFEMTKKHLTKGYEYDISFSKNKLITAGIRSTDWEHNGLGHGGGISATGYANVSKATLIRDPKSGVEAYSNSGTFIAGILATEVGCGSDNLENVKVAYLMLGALKNSSIAFLYVEDDSTIKGAVVSEDCNLDNFQKYLTKQHLEELKSIGGTIKTL